MIPGVTASRRRSLLAAATEFRFYRLQMTSQHSNVIALMEVEMYEAVSGGVDLLVPSTPVTTSSSDYGWVGSNLVNGDQGGTGWHSNGALPQDVVFDLGVPKPVRRMRITARPFGGQSPKDFTLAGSASATGPWTIVGVFNEPADWNGQTKDYLPGPAFVSDPTITGDSVAGALLSIAATATPGSTLTYQWRKNGADIPGANGATYQLQQADIESTISCVVGLSGSGVTKTTARYVGENPTSTRWRILTQTARDGYLGFMEIEMRAAVGGPDQLVGGTATHSGTSLNANTGPEKGVDDNLTTIFHSANNGQVHAYEYNRPTPFAVNQLWIKARTDDTYDVGPRQFRLQYWNGVEWVNKGPQQDGGGWGLGQEKTFATSDIYFSSNPVISGTPTAGSTLTVAYTAPANVPAARQWLRNGVAISGATGLTYQVVADDIGKNLTCRVTLGTTNPVVATSPAVAGITLGPELWNAAAASYSGGWSRANNIITANNAVNRVDLPNVLSYGKPYRVTIAGNKTGGANLRFISDDRTSFVVISPPSGAFDMATSFRADGSSFHIEADAANFHGTIPDAGISLRRITHQVADDDTMFQAMFNTATPVDGVTNVAGFLYGNAYIDIAGQTPPQQMVFDGTGDHCWFDYLPGLNVTPNWTLEWHLTMDANQMGVPVSRANTGSERWVAYCPGNGRMEFYCNAYNTGTPLLAMDGGLDGAEHHWAVVRDGGTWRLYRDGIQVASQAWAGQPPKTSGHGLFIGTDNGNINGADIVGRIGRVKMSKVARYPGGTTFLPPSRLAA